MHQVTIAAIRSRIPSTRRDRPARRRGAAASAGSRPTVGARVEMCGWICRLVRAAGRYAVKARGAASAGKAGPQTRCARDGARTLEGKGGDLRPIACTHHRSRCTSGARERYRVLCRVACIRTSSTPPMESVDAIPSYAATAVIHRHPRMSAVACVTGGCWCGANPRRKLRVRPQRPHDEVGTKLRSSTDGSAWHGPHNGSCARSPGA